MGTRFGPQKWDPKPYSFLFQFPVTFQPNFEQSLYLTKKWEPNRSSFWAPGSIPNNSSPFVVYAFWVSFGTHSEDLQRAGRRASMPEPRAKKVITGGAAYAHVCSGTRAECFCKRRNANLILRALRALLPEASRRFPERPRASRRPPEGFPRASQSLLEAPKSSQNVPARLGSSQNATRTSQNVPEVSKRPPSKHPMFMKTLL